MEHQRTQDVSGAVWQWVDTVNAMVLDAVTGEPQRFGKNLQSVGTLQEAAEYVSKRPGWEDRMVIVKLETIRAFKVGPPSEVTELGDGE